MARRLLQELNMVHDEVSQAPMEGRTLLANDGAPTPDGTLHTEKGITVHALSLDGLLLDPDVQPRATMSRGVIADYTTLYADDGAEALPPIVVYQQGSDAWVADGFHRVAAAQQAGLAALPATCGLGRNARLCCMPVAPISTANR
jgi:hypothetical protein